ncbi:uncharacterized protein HD556DRAFT_1380045 [Suillus plorans]|uniref:Uncharacterized protein n=1 Tax=Suillus plorans TaxID=116603 RepID=A0A9P7AMC7_9AGAM|nr:uncharacterized protein HD556DRAFT_1380045 [Suillus plorans]KAG1792497.1 hypothetical protein HD556DRAFT_1380045 [Suillus plorans]
MILLPSFRCVFRCYALVLFSTPGRCRLMFPCFQCSSPCHVLYVAPQLQLLGAADCIGFQHPFFGSHHIALCFVLCRFRLALVK